MISSEYQYPPEVEVFLDWVEENIISSNQELPHPQYAVTFLAIKKKKNITNTGKIAKRRKLSKDGLVLRLNVLGTNLEDDHPLGWQLYLAAFWSLRDPTDENQVKIMNESLSFFRKYSSSC